MAIQIISGEVYSDMLAEAEAITGVKHVIWYLGQVIVMTGADIPVTPNRPGNSYRTDSAKLTT